MIGMTAADYEAIREQTRKAKARELRKLERLQEEMKYSPNAENPAEHERLQELVALYCDKFPWITYANGGSRAHKAMGYLLEGHVAHVGGDQWLVKGHRCGLNSKQCTCKDHVRIDKAEGKLCAHRLAVMLRENWHGKRCLQLVELIEQLSEYEYIDLYMERDYAYHGEGERVAVAGYLLPGAMYPVHWLAWERFDVSLVQFQWAMEQTGYALVRLPEKLPDASHYYYRIAKGEGLPIIKQSYHFRGQTDAMIEREKARKISAVEFAVTLDEVTRNSALYFHFSQYEAQRIMAMKRAIDQYGIRAIEIDKLPDNVVSLVMMYIYGKDSKDNE